MKAYRKILLTVILFCSLIVLFNNCINNQKQSTDPRGNAYIGSAKCETCHKNIYDSYIKTAHYLSSLPASKQAIKGSFNLDSNFLYYRPTLKVAMEERDSAFHQVAYIDDIPIRSARFDIVVGSGRKGQSYLYWYNENIFQLPVSYYAPEHSWVNSPGYDSQTVNFSRNIPVGCFHCHSSYIDKTSTQPVGQNLYDFFNKNRIVYGIDCERCHGPATNHVTFHENNPQEKKAKFIVSSSSLDRDEKVAMCAVCHSGARKIINSTFYYKPGEKLSNYLFPDTATLRTADIDVHGKQYQLLSGSKCFLGSKTLSCSSCHNTHVSETDNIINFSKKCMSCHNNPNHSSGTATTLSRAEIEKNCIDCHMPAKPSAIITMKSQTNAAPIPALVRTHYISIYPNETKKFKFMHNNQ